MINAHIYLDDTRLHKHGFMEHCPRVGDTVRVSSTVCAVVTEVVWCLDESWELGQRVNIRLESETP